MKKISNWESLGYPNVSPEEPQLITEFEKLSCLLQKVKESAKEIKNELWLKKMEPVISEAIQQGKEERMRKKIMSKSTFSEQRQSQAEQDYLDQLHILEKEIETASKDRYFTSSL